MTHNQYAEIIARHADRAYSPRLRPAELALITTSTKPSVRKP